MYCYITKSFHETGDRRMSPFDYDFPFPNPWLSVTLCPVIMPVSQFIT